MKARDMNVNQYIDWDQCRAASSRVVDKRDWRSAQLRAYAATVPIDGFPDLTVVEQVTKDIERLAGAEAGLESWAIY